MRPLPLLLWILWVFLVLLVKMPSPSSPSQSSSFPQRTKTHIRQARQLANIAPYRLNPANAPLRALAPNPNGNAPLRALAPRPNGDLESQRTAHRDADRERQLELQETPPRRRRRMPQHRVGDENRAPSPTPVARRHIEQPVFAGVGTPPDSQRPLPPDKRAAAQRARRERERQAAAAAPVSEQRPTLQQTAQRARRERERQQREQAERQQQEQVEQQNREAERTRERERVQPEGQRANQLLTPPATNRERPTGE
ncbi:hypothetical protein B0H13DRAFT_1887296 [Mycena leptocephala]|nr:hypothetical protein B0H13DRAFT_1887296 [Mycena leptocephala]